MPAEPAEPFDPRDVSLEEAAPGNQYLTKKDVKVILAGVAFVLLILWPLYIKGRDYKDRYSCGLNMHAMSVAMQAYAESNDGRFPPCFIPGADDAHVPRTDSRNRPYTWASTLVNIVGLDKDRNFECPSASSNEGMVAEGLNGADLRSDYGMYIAESAASREGSSSSSGTVLIAESANGGAAGTFDPTPLSAESDGSVRDGFILSWAGNNFEPPAASDLHGSNISRIAFRNTQKGLNRKADQGRHDDTIYVIFADGHYQLMRAERLLGSALWQLPTP